MHNSNPLMLNCRRPQFSLLLRAVIWSLIIVNTGVGQVLKEEPPPEGEIVIYTEAFPDRLKFTVGDPEKYEILNVTCRSLKALEQLDNVEFACENLSPCSAYQATVTVRNLNDQKITDNIVDTLTEYVEPQVEITDIETFVEEIHLTWSATARTCISEFQIEVSSDGATYKDNKKNDQSEWRIEKLKPCQKQHVQLKTYNINNELVSNRTDNTKFTKYAEADTIEVTIEPYQNAQMKVTWEQPKYMTCIDFYYLKWFRLDCSAGGAHATTPQDRLFTADSKEEIDPVTPDNGLCGSFANLTDGIAKEYIIGNLQGCDIYGFEIYINYNTTSKCGLEHFNSPEQVPGQVRMQEPEIRSTRVTFHWQPPADHSKCVNHYEVFVDGPLQRLEDQKHYNTATEEHESMFESLEPCGDYHVQIIAISLNGSVGPVSDAPFKTLEAKPTQVINAAVSSAPHALTVSWEPPSFSELCLTGYRISGWNDEHTSDGNFDQTVRDKTSVEIQGLYSCQSYTVQIIPTTENMDGEPQQIDAETAAIVAAAPDKFQKLAVFPHSIELSAVEVDINSTCGVIFARFACKAASPDGVPNKYAEQYVEQRSSISFKATITPLSPFTSYLCKVAFFNVAGWSPESQVLLDTEPYYPDPPEQFTLVDSTNTSLSFSWKDPKFTNGNIYLYTTHFQRVAAAYFIPSTCSAIKKDPIAGASVIPKLSVTALQPYTKYSVQVATQNDYGIGEYTRPFIVETKPWISDPVVNVKLISEGPFVSNTEYKANVVVSWTIPCKSNGEIESFKLEFVGERLPSEREYFVRSVLPDFSDDGSMTYNETNLKPDYNYTVRIVVKNKDVELTSSESRGEFEAPAGIPHSFSNSVIKRTKVDAFESDNPTNSAVVRLPSEILESESGNVLYIAFLLSEKGCIEEPPLRFGALNPQTEWPKVPSWQEVYKDDPTNCITQYQTTPKLWRPTTRNRLSTGNDNAGKVAKATGSDDKMIEYTIGSESCDSSKESYCNGPLKPATEYNLVVRLFTKSGYNDAALLEFKTDSLIQLMLILISVSSCMLMAFVVGIIYFWIIKRIKWKRESCHGIEDSFGDINPRNFAVFYREISKPEKVSREFKELTVVALDLSISASELGSNKNRYADIFPYDKNRVILDIDADGTDYINASFIDGYKHKKEYIATQGPKLESILDFWRMVLQHNVRVIVMVTQFRESDIIKCHEYYPFNSKGINVTIKKKDNYDLYDRTEMLVTHDVYSMKQKVVHFYFKKWPDHGCPSDPMHLISFVRKVKAEKLPSFSPIVVHCSAGVGRTGTFIALDIIMQRLKYESKINIYEVVKKLRFQRMKMVQTLTQFTFLYNCTYELVKHKNPRVAVVLENNNTKKVSFEDDAESSTTTPPTKFISRRHGSDLSSVDEHETDTDNDVATNGIVKSAQTSYGTIPIWQFGAGNRKGSDIVSLEEQEYDHFSGNNSESAM